MIILHCTEDLKYLMYFLFFYTKKRKKIMGLGRKWFWFIFSLRLLVASPQLLPFIRPYVLITWKTEKCRQQVKKTTKHKLKFEIAPSSRVLNHFCHWVRNPPHNFNYFNISVLTLKLKKKLSIEIHNKKLSNQNLINFFNCRNFSNCDPT